jgi:ubiquinone/menaquinone biosynthesis C-methylase UbiE
VDTSEEWDRIFSGSKEGDEEAWLERWRHVLEAGRDSSVLDLGCGAGQDTLFLTELGFTVVAADFSEEALRLTRERAPVAKTENVNLNRGLPFPDARFGAIASSLSLHYFPWHQITRILDDVRRCLRPEGHLLARFNSTRTPLLRRRKTRDREQLLPRRGECQSASSTDATSPRSSQQAGRC